MPSRRTADIFRTAVFLAGVMAATIAVVLFVHFLVEGHSPLSHPHDTLILASLVVAVSVLLSLWRRYP